MSAAIDGGAGGASGVAGAGAGAKSDSSIDAAARRDGPAPCMTEEEAAAPSESASASRRAISDFMRVERRCASSGSTAAAESSSGASWLPLHESAPKHAERSLFRGTVRRANEAAQRQARGWWESTEPSSIALPSEMHANVHTPHAHGATAPQSARQQRPHAK